MNKTSKICILIIFVVMLVVIIVPTSLKKDSNDTKKDIINNVNLDEENQVINVLLSADILYDLSDTKVMSDISDYIAIVKINSIDGASNINKKTNEYVSTYSYGKASILKMLKGNIDSKEINYTRSGGKMLYTDWVKGQASPDKVNNMMRTSKNIDLNKLLVYDKYENDIDIEVGKIYLAYMYQEPSFNSANEYVIHGFQYGLREISGDTKNYNDISKIKVKNNNTLKYEDLSSIVK